MNETSQQGRISFGVGVPLNDIPADHTLLTWATTWCQAAEDLGFDFVTLPHHRFTPGYPCSPWVMLGALAARTSRLRLGTAVFLLALDHPLDVAEEIATLDQISGGRAFLGAGLGYRRYEWDALQLPYDRRGARFTEALEVVTRAWQEDTFAYHGEHFDFDEVHVFPRPVQQPRPPIWIGANAPPGIRRASRLADCWIVGFGDRLAALGPTVSDFRSSAEGHGRAGEICLMRLVGIGASEVEVEEEWLPGVLAMLRGYRRAGAPGEPSEQASTTLRQHRGAPRLGDLGDMIVAGSPDDVIAGVARCHEATGCEYFIPTLGGPDPRAALELFGREVIPAFR